MLQIPRVILPTSDSGYYLARARLYARHAEHEADLTIRQTLQALERECKRKADEISAAPPEPDDVMFREP